MTIQDYPGRRRMARWKKDANDFFRGPLEMETHMAGNSRHLVFRSASSRTRTGNPLIKSQML